MKKKLKRFLLLLLIGFIGFFIYSNTRYNGTYMGTYELWHHEGAWPSAHDRILDVSTFNFQLYQPFV